MWIGWCIRKTFVNIILFKKKDLISKEIRGVIELQTLFTERRTQPMYIGSNCQCQRSYYCYMVNNYNNDKLSLLVNGYSHTFRQLGIRRKTTF